MNWIDQNENDFREIERAIELPPDEPHPRYVDDDEEEADDDKYDVINHRDEA